MAINYNKKFNPFTGKLQFVLDPSSVNGVNFQPGVANEAALPAEGNSIGDARFTNDTHHLWIWNGEAWTDQGDIIDLNWGVIEGDIANQTDLQNALGEKADQSDLEAHEENTDNPHNVTASQVPTDNSGEDVQSKLDSLDLEIAKAFDSGIQFFIDGAGAVIATGIAGWVEVPFDCTIEEARLLADQSGSIVIDIWKDTYENYPPTDADSITASAKPTITTAIKSEDTTLTGWTTSVSKGDILYFNVDSATTIQRCLISLTVKKV